MPDTASTYGPYTDSGAEESPATTQPAPEAGRPAPETVSTAPATAPTIAPARTDETLNNLPSAPPQSFASKTYHGILAALGGSHDTVLSRDPVTGAMIATQHTAQPGEQWKRIISGALTGFAGAQAAGTQGPGGTMRGLAGGIQAGTQRAQQNYNQARNEANEDFKAQQQAATDNANRSMQAHQIAESEFRLMNMKKQADQADMDSLNTYNQVISDGGPGTVDLGSFKNPGEIYKFAAQYKEAHNIHAEGRVFMHGDYDKDGNRIGVRAAFVTNDWLNSKTTEPYSFTIEQPGEDGQLHDETIQIPAGEKNSVLMPFISGMNAARNKKLIDQENADTRSQLADIKQQLADLKASGGGNEGTWQQMEDENGKPILFNSKTRETITAAGVQKPGTHAKEEAAEWGPAGQKAFMDWHKENVTPALQKETTYQLSSNVYNEYQALRKQGKDFPTGAQSVQMLANHIQGTIGAVKGGRVTKDIIQKHLGARDVSDDLQVAIQKLYGGGVLSSGQWDAFFQMIGQTRDETWRAVLNDAKPLGMPLDRIAFPADLRQRWGLPAERAWPAQQQPATPGIEQPLAPARPMPQGQTNVGGVPVTVRGNVPSSAVTPPIKVQPNEQTAKDKDGNTLVVRNGKWVIAQP